jgi:glycosyltransferase involved in cell wall biosynthesis
MSTGSPRPPVIGVDASRLSITERTGTEQYTAGLLPALLAAAEPERLRFYFNRPLTPPPAWLTGAEQRIIPLPRLWTHGRLAAELRRTPPDLLFVPAHVVPFGVRVPSVVTIHDLGYRYFPGAHRLASRLYLELSTRWSAWSARRIIAISEQTRRDLMRAYRVPAERIDVVYHGIHERFRPPADPAAALATVHTLGLRPPYLLAVGTIQPRKNYPRLIAALARLRAAGYPHQLVIVGRAGWLAAETLAAPAAYGVASQVVLTGYLPDELLPAVYANAEAVVLPSLYEGLGMPAAEALACGTPLACADTTALPEVAGQAAVYFDPRSVDSMVSALSQLLATPTRRAALRQAGLAQAARFTWTQCARATLASLRLALAEAARPTPALS